MRDPFNSVQGQNFFFSSITYCASLENKHTPPMEGGLISTPTPLEILFTLYFVENLRL